MVAIEGVWNIFVGFVDGWSTRCEKEELDSFQAWGIMGLLALEKGKAVGELSGERTEILVMVMVSDTHK